MIEMIEKFYLCTNLCYFLFRMIILKKFKTLTFNNEGNDYSINMSYDEKYEFTTFLLSINEIHNPFNYTWTKTNCLNIDENDNILYMFLIPPKSLFDGIKDKYGNEISIYDEENWTLVYKTFNYDINVKKQYNYDIYLLAINGKQYHSFVIPKYLSYYFFMEYLKDMKNLPVCANMYEHDEQLQKYTTYKLNGELNILKIEMLKSCNKSHEYITNFLTISEYDFTLIDNDIYCDNHIKMMCTMIQESLKKSISNDNIIYLLNGVYYNNMLNISMSDIFLLIKIFSKHSNVLFQILTVELTFVNGKIENYGMLNYMKDKSCIFVINADNLNYTGKKYVSVAVSSLIFKGSLENDELLLGRDNTLVVNVMSQNTCMSCFNVITDNLIGNIDISLLL